MLARNRISRWGIMLLTLAVLSAPAVSSDALDLLQENTDGVVGVFLKEVDGPVRDAFQETTIFEGASTNKTMIHTHAMLQVQSGAATLDEMVPVALDLVGSCPQGTGEVMESLEEVLRQMMQASDNARTQAARDRFGDVNINATVQALGMVDSLLNPDQTLGCGSEALEFPNQLTAVDLGLLYEQVLGGFLDAPTREKMFELMLNESNSFFIDGLINDEALDVGLAADEILAFKAAIAMAHKGGSYTLIPEEGPAQEYRSLGGFIELPFACEGESRQLVYVAFVDNASTLDAQGTGSDLDIFEVARELLRPVIREALESALCDRIPEVEAPAPIMLECNTTGGVDANDSQVQAWLGMAAASDECDEVAPESDAPAFFPSGCAPGLTTDVMFSATDSCEGTGTDASSVTVQDTTAPTLQAPGDTTVECTSPDGAFVSLIASGSDVCDGVLFQNSRTGETNDASGIFPLGETTVAWEAFDDCANETADSTTVTVQDTTAPMVECEVGDSLLWPPNHKLVDVGLAVQVTDICDPDPEIEVQVTSDELPANAPGSGGAVHCPDAVVCGDSVELRAERSAIGDGRVYVITVTATDASGNAATCQTTVDVPHDMRSQGGTAVDSGQDHDPTDCDRGNDFAAHPASKKLPMSGRTTPRGRQSRPAAR